MWPLLFQGQLRARAKNHKTKFHKATSTLNCKICNFITDSENELNSHIQEIHKTNGHNFDKCESTTDKRVNLSSHIDTHSQGQFKCYEGEKTFMKRHVLKRQEETELRHVANFNVSHSKTYYVEAKLMTYNEIHNIPVHCFLLLF